MYIKKRHQCAELQRLRNALKTTLPPKLRTNAPKVAAASKSLVLVPHNQPSSSSDLVISRVHMKFYLGTAVPGQPAASASWTNKSPVAPHRALTCIGGCIPSCLVYVSG